MIEELIQSIEVQQEYMRQGAMVEARAIRDAAQAVLDAGPQEMRDLLNAMDAHSRNLIMSSKLSERASLLTSYCTQYHALNEVFKAMDQIQKAEEKANREQRRKENNS